MLRFARNRSVYLAAPLGVRWSMLVGILAATLALVLAIKVIGPVQMLGALLGAVILFYRRFELAATSVLVISLCIDWYRAGRVLALVCAVALLVTLYFMQSAQRPWVTPSHPWLWGLFLVLAIPPAVRGALTVHDAVIYYPSIVLGASLMFWIGMLLARDARSLRSLYNLFALFGTFVAVHVIIQATTGITLFSAPLALDYLQTANDYTMNGVVRAGSFFIQPNFCGTFLVMMAFLSLGLAIASATLAAKLFYCCQLLLILPAVLFTYSASAWAAAGFGLAVFAAFAGRTRSRIQIALLVGVAGATLLIGFSAQVQLLLQHASDPTELAIRSNLWQAAWQVILAHPLTGVGLGHRAYMLQVAPVRLVNRVIPYDHPHNTYLEWGAMAGLPVLIAFLALLIVSLDDARRNWLRADTKTRSLLGAGIAAIAAFCLASWSNQGWTLPPLAAFGWMLLGCIASPLLTRPRAQSGESLA